MRKIWLVAICLMVALTAGLAGGAVNAQQATTDIWKLVPPSSMAVAAFDTRPDNASIQAMMNAQDPQAKDLLAQQNIAMRKAIEDFATLFGVSLDFAKDIDPWQDQQWAFVLLPGEKNSPQPVFLIASKDAAAANAAMQKLLEPWGRIGELVPEPDQDFRITAFRTKDKGTEVFVSAYNAVVAVSCNKESLKTALKGGGFAAGSAGDKAFSALSGSLFYAYADASLLKVFDVKPETVPVSGIGAGVSAIDTGMKLRVLGYPTENGAAMLKQMLPNQQAGSLLANPGVPASSLVAASLPNLAGTVAMGGAMGFNKSPLFAAALAASQMQISGALTAVFPKLAWVVSGMADTPEAAATKRSEIEGGLRASKIPVEPAGNGISGIKIGEGTTVYVSQVGKHVLLSDDVHSLTNAAAVVNGTQPDITKSKTYQETMAGLGNSNLLTLYANLAPIQGLGFLAEGFGLNQLAPVYDSFAKSLQNVQSMGIGAGFDGEVVSATIFLRAKPGMAPTIGPAAIAGTAVGAAVIFPMFARARDEARTTQCTNYMKQLVMAARVYAHDNGGKLPPGANWRTKLVDEYTKVNLQCLSGEVVYAMNRNFAGQNIEKMKDPATKVLFFEASPSLPNALGSRADAIFPHHGEGMFGFADGHVERLCEAPAQSQWLPSVAKKPATKPPVRKAPARKRKH